MPNFTVGCDSDQEEHTKRMLWSAKEVDDMFDIIEMKNVPEMMRRKKRRREIFKFIKHEMEKYGHNKTSMQIFNKYKNLCSMYRNGLKNGINRKDAKYEHFERMHELFGSLLKGEESAPEEAIVHEEVDENTMHADDIEEGIEEVHVEQYEEHEEPMPSSSKRRRLSTASGHIEQELPKRSSPGPDPTLDVKYVKSVNYLVNSFFQAQEELQNKFFKQQLTLQKQQQEWEEYMLDQERDFLTKFFDYTQKHTAPVDVIETEDGGTF